MLAFSRKEGESIMIGDDVEIVIVQVMGRGKIRIGIKAPSTIVVHRKEVWLKVKEQQQPSPVPQDEKGAAIANHPQAECQDDHRHPDADFQVGG